MPSVFENAISLSVVVPTFNEKDNVAEIVRRLEGSLTDVSWEVVFVDDASPDGTADRVRELARSDRRVRLISRHNRRGLSSAVVEGALAASAPIIAVMDGDLQHDEDTLPEMYRVVASGEAEVASASRFLLEDGADGLSSEARLKLSNTGIRLTNKAFGLQMTDPLTGFFVFRRHVIERALPEISELGFKVLLDIIVSAEPRPKVKEVAFKFRDRLTGESKLDNRVLYDFFLFFVHKKVSRIVPLPARFLSFSLINAFGILVHLAVFMPLIALFGAGFALAQLIATFVAMFFNYAVNNALTYSDRRLRGRQFYTGFAIFVALCSVGVIGNVGVASMLQKEFAGVFYVIPAVLGAVVTVVWNFGATKAFVWGSKRRGRAFKPANVAEISPEAQDEALVNRVAKKSAAQS